MNMIAKLEVATVKRHQMIFYRDKQDLLEEPRELDFNSARHNYLVGLQVLTAILMKQ